MPETSIAIMAHPSRATWVAELLEELGPVPVAWAREPYATSGDQAPVWETRKAALAMAEAEFHCVLQDDVVLARGFRERLGSLPMAPDRIGMLFYRHKYHRPEARIAARRALGAGGFLTHGMVLGPGLVFPTERIADLIVSGEDGTSDGDDPRIERWAVSRGIGTWVPIPSLVDHRRGPSLVGHSPRRRAWRFDA